MFYDNYDDENQNADFLGDYEFDLEAEEDHDYESDGGSIFDLHDQDLTRPKPAAADAADQDGAAPDADDDAEEIGFAARFAVAADRVTWLMQTLQSGLGTSRVPKSMI